MLANPPLPQTAPGSGILWAYRFDADGHGIKLAGDPDDAARETGAGWLWVHLSLADTRCRNWIEQRAPILEPVRDILIGAEEHLRLELYGRDIAGVIPDLQLEYAQPTEDLRRLRFALTDRMLITIRRSPLRAIEHVRGAIVAGTPFAAPADLLEGIVDHFADFVGIVAERLGDTLDAAEERVWDDDFDDQGRRIARARNQAARIHRQLAQTRVLFHRLEPRVAAARPELAIAFRSLAQKLDAFDHMIAEIQERARLLQDEIAAKMAAVTNRRLFTLSMLTAAILPPTLVTGFFGMNTRDLPFAQTEGGTSYALALAAAAAALTYWALTRLRAL